MSEKMHPEIGPFAMVEDFGGNSVFNDSDEEQRYQEFKERLTREVVARTRSSYNAMWIDTELHDTTRTGE